jgi:hypothetical protein
MTPTDYTNTLQAMHQEAEQAAKDLPPQSNVIAFPSRSERWSREFCRPMPDPNLPGAA